MDLLVVKSVPTIAFIVTDGNKSCRCTQRVVGGTVATTSSATGRLYTIKEKEQSKKPLYQAIELQANCNTY